MFLETAETICLGDPPCLSLPRHEWQTYVFLWWDINMHLDELMRSKNKITEVLLGKLLFWAQNAIWALAGWFWSVSEVEDHFISTDCSSSILSTGSDFCLCLRPFVSNELSLGHFANWFWHVSTIEGYWCWRNACLELHTGHPLSWFGIVLSFGVWMCAIVSCCLL